MKFSCLKEHLGRALGIAERFTGKNVTLPILGSVLLTAKKNALLISATNLEYAVEVLIPGQGTGDSKLCVPSRVLNSFIQALPEDKISLEENRGNLLIKTSTQDTRINGMPPEDFPLIPKIKKASSFRIDGSSLAQALGKVLSSASPSEFRPELAGIFFKVSSSALHLAATDTFRLAEVTLGWDGKKPEDRFSFILPYRTGQEVARSFGEEEIEVAVGENQVEFSTLTTRVVSRLTDGNFPDYQAIVPQKFETTGFLNRKEFITAVRGSTTFASKLQEVSLDFEEGRLVVSAQNPDVGEYKTEFPISLTGKRTRISFNNRYLLDGLDAFDGEELFVGLNGQDGPALLREKSGGEFLYVIMPIRLT